MSNTTLDVLLVSEEKIKAYTNLNTNLAPEELVPYIWDAQNILMPNYVGGTYYKALKERVKAGTLTEADITLLDQFVAPMICNFGFYYATTFIQYRSYNKGILKGTSDNGETLDLDELKFLQSQIKNIAEAYAAQMINHLITHSSQYPLYNSATNKDGQLPDKSLPFTVNITVPHLPYAYNQRLLRSVRNGGYGYYNGGFVGPDCYNMPDSN